jgi:hypothetical protein
MSELDLLYAIEAKARAVVKRLGTSVQESWARSPVDGQRMHFRAGNEDIYELEQALDALANKMREGWTTR